MSVAKRLCPHAAVVPGRFDRYREVSAAVFRLFHEVTPLVEPLSIDEAFLDVTGSLRLLGAAEGIARRLKDRIHSETGLTASVGVAPNKFLAKLASDMNKPDGLTVVRPDEAERLLAPLPVGRIFGVGPKTAARLEGVGVKTIGDLRAVPLEVLRRRVGGEAERYRELAAGIDDRPVVPDSEAKSIGQEETFGADLADQGEVRDVLLRQVEAVAARLRRHGLRGRTVTVKIRFGDFQPVTRRCTLPRPTDATADLWRAAREQFDRWAEGGEAGGGFRPVRLIGVAAGGLATAAGQMELFADPAAERQRRLDAAVDAINRRFGRGTVRRVGG
jgi:DNA polymerase-4